MELSKVIEEIQLVPENRLQKIHDLIHSFRADTEIVRNDPTEIMGFAGCWQDMTDEEFEGFSQEITARRKQAFSGRTGRETITD
uniref:Uncharacterized protein n=1 Tax=Candidatus Kentrum sp. FW TaxID=2126338 RepID=A0A450U0M4_9GAMM|nr:MAG: hypothetical protein BECKFW1821C_GA0114237_10889 [Candidatus Kentron sp. FW]